MLKNVRKDYLSEVTLYFCGYVLNIVFYFE